MALGAVFTAVAVALAIPAVRDALGDALSGDTASVREDLRDSGAGGVAMVIALGMLHTVVWYPAEILDAAAGYVYGFGPALPLVMGVWIASGLAAYYIGRHAARPFLYKLAGEERFLRLERAIDRGGWSFLLACRLVPIVPFSLTGLVAGAARVPVVALHLDHGGRLPADHRLLHLPRQPARGVLARGPDPLDRRRRAAAGPVRDPPPPLRRGRGPLRSRRAQTRGLAQAGSGGSGSSAARRPASSRSSGSRSAHRRSPAADSSRSESSEASSSDRPLGSFVWKR